MCERIPVSEAREKWREVISRAEFGQETTILTHRGKDVAAIVPVSSVNRKTFDAEKKKLSSTKRPKKSKSA
jgi:prevent-host-death family protein